MQVSVRVVLMETYIYLTSYMYHAVPPTLVLSLPTFDVPLHLNRSMHADVCAYGRLWRLRGQHRCCLTGGPTFSSLSGVGNHSIVHALY